MSEQVSDEQVQKAAAEYDEGNRAPWVERLLAEDHRRISAALKTRTEERDRAVKHNKILEDTNAGFVERMAEYRVRAEKAEAKVMELEQYD